MGFYFCLWACLHVCSVVCVAESLVDESVCESVCVCARLSVYSCGEGFAGTVVLVIR